MGGRGLASVIAVSALLVVPAAVAAAEFEGGSGQKNKVTKLRTNDKGVVTRFSIEWRAPCRYGGTIDAKSVLVPPFDRSGRAGFADKRKVKSSDDGFDIKVKLSVTGERHGEHAYAGRFKLTADYYEPGGSYVSTCRTGVVDWFAHD
jgi:hypothetical protein